METETPAMPADVTPETTEEVEPVKAEAPAVVEPPKADDDDAEEGKAIPYTQFAKAIHRRQAAEAAAKEATAQAEEAAARAAEFEAKHGELSKELAQKVVALDLARAGVFDEDLVELVASKWDTVDVGEDGSKPPFAEWFAEYRKGKTYLNPAGVVEVKPKPITGNQGAGEVDGRSILDRVHEMSDREYRENKVAIDKALAEARRTR